MMCENKIYGPFRGIFHDLSSLKDWRVYHTKFPAPSALSASVYNMSSCLFSFFVFFVRFVVNNAKSTSGNRCALTVTDMVKRF